MKKKIFIKKENELLQIKELNKKVKENTPLKEKDEEKEYNLVIILKSLLNIFYNASRQLNLGNDTKEELNIPAIEAYFDQFLDKPYYNIKIYPILEILKSYYILSKQESGFKYAIEDIKNYLDNNKKITDSQIDIINYILINRFKKFVGSEDCEFFFELSNIFDKINKKEYKYLFEYYTIILLINIYFVDLDKIPNKNKIGNEILQTLYAILNNEKNGDILEFAFLLFCEYYMKVENINVQIYRPIKWCLLILKLLKGKFLLFNFDINEDNKLYDYIKSFHYKYFLGEIKRNKQRGPISEHMISVGQNISQNIILPENLEEAQKYLNDKKYEKFPKELFLPRGPSNNVYKYLFNFNNDFSTNKEKYKTKLEEKKRNIICGVLQICYSILKNNDYEEEEIDEKYFSLKLSKEIVSLFSSFYNDKRITRLSLLCLAKMFKICPEQIIQYLPSIFETLKYLGDKKNKYFIYLCGSLDAFFKVGSEIIKKAYDENDTRIINEINKIYHSDDFFVEIYSILLVINNLPNMKIVKKDDKNSEVNFDSLLINSFNFFITFVNQFFLATNHLTLTGEIILTTVIINHSNLYIRKYTTTILSKIYNKNVLISIYKYLLLDDSNNLQYKQLFYVIYLLLASDKHNYLDFLVEFLKKNIIFEISSGIELLKYFSEHIKIKRNNHVYISGIQDEIDDQDEQINHKGNDVLLFSFSYPKKNSKLFKYIVDIIFMCIKDMKNYDDINIPDLIKLCLINAFEIEEKNITILMNYLMNYINNINTNMKQTANESIHQKHQNNLKKLFEILYYTNFYINISVNKENFIINNHIFLISFCLNILKGILQLFPNNYSTKEHNFSNIISLIYLYIFTVNNLKDISHESIEQKKIINNRIVDIVKNNYSSFILKHKYQFNSCHLAIFYFLFFLKDIDNKDLLLFISKNCLNSDEFKFENYNSNLNPFYFILINFLILILIYQESFNKYIANKLSTKKPNIMSFLDIKSPVFIQIYEIIKKNLKDINQNIDSNKESKTIITDVKEKFNFINENLKFNANTYFIDISFIKNNNINIDNDDNDENLIIDKNNNKNLKKIKVEKYLLEKNKIYNFNYQMWKVFVPKVSDFMKIKKIKRIAVEQEIKNKADLLKNVFSFYQNKIEIMISLIKSEKLSNNDMSLFMPLLSNIGEIITKDNTFQFQKEYAYRKYIIHLDKIDLNDILIVLIKNNLQEFDNSILEEKNIIYIKPLLTKSVYLIKIHKNSNNDINSDTNNKLFQQLDNEINSIFSDFMIIDFNNEEQVNYFFSIINILFIYSLLEKFINL